MPYTLPPLPYAHNALEPHIDARTMEIHHGKHHQAYIDKVNKALEGTVWEGKPIEEVLRNLAKIPEDTRPVVRNHGGGHANHSLFWTIMSPDGGGEPSGALGAALKATFGGFARFREEFTNAATARFGSGWTWLVVDQPAGASLEAGLSVLSTPNQDSPLSEGKTPILGLDVWEHAYYLHYQNRRPDYVASWWNIVNWEEVNRRYREAKGA